MGGSTEIEGTTDPASASRLQQLVRLAARLSRAVSVRDAAQLVATAGAEELAADSVTVYLLEDAGQHLHLAASAGMDPDLQEQFSTFGLAEPLPGAESLRHRTVICYQTVDERNARYPQFAGHPGGSGSVIIAPMVLNGGLRIGVLTLGWHAEHRATPDAQVFVQAVADLCGQAVHRAQLSEWQRQAYRGQRFLVDATRLLNASLDMDATMHQVAHMAVPDVAEVCAVCLTDSDGSLRPVVAATDDPDRQEILDKLVARSPIIRNPHLTDIAAGAHGVLMPVLDPGEREARAEDADHLGLLHALHATSAIVVPLRVREHRLGLLVLVMTGDAPPLRAADLALAEDLASRAAMAIDNARLYTEVDRRADNLSHALDTRIVIEQAKGMLAERWGTSPADAFDRLRRAARGQRRSIHDLATAVLAGTDDPDPPDTDDP